MVTLSKIAARSLTAAIAALALLACEGAREAAERDAPAPPPAPPETPAPTPQPTPTLPLTSPGGGGGSWRPPNRHVGGSADAPTIDFCGMQVPVDTTLIWCWYSPDRVDSATSTSAAPRSAT